MGSFVALVVVLALLLFLGVIIRFSFIGPARTKGWRERVRRPEKSDVESKWNVKLPESVETYFRGEIVARSDFYLAPPGSKQSSWWYIERFVPFTCRDLPEWMAVTKVPGIPIAIDASKGTYYIPFEPLRRNLPCPILLRLPGRKREDREVASSFDEFMKFEPRGVAEEE
jgi:hypothetical protein